MTSINSQEISSNPVLPEKSGQQKSTDTYVKEEHSKSAKITTSDEIYAASINAKATRCAASIGALVTVIAGVGLFFITKHYQDIDGRQKALNDYVASMKELLVSTEINQENSQIMADLQDSRTFLVMRELDNDGDRKGQILRFLYETCLITTKRCTETPNGSKAAKIDLSGINLNGVSLKDTWAPNMNLKGAYMKKSNLQNAALPGAKFTDANLEESELQNATLEWALFDKADLAQVKLMKAQLFHASFAHANLTKADLSGANLQSTNLQSANLRGTNLTKANLTEANFSNAIYDDKTQGITEQQKGVMIRIAPGVSLQGKDLSNQDLSGADFSGADLSGANLSGANLSGANLSGANLTNTLFTDANLKGAVFCNTTVPPNITTDEIITTCQP